MPIIYLFQLEELATIYTKNVGFIEFENDEKLDKLKFGDLTSLFNNKNIIHKILHKKIIKMDIDFYMNIIRKKHTNSILSLHSLRGSYYLTLDNQIWRLLSEESINDKLVEYYLTIK